MLPEHCPALSSCVLAQLQFHWSVIWSYQIERPYSKRGIRNTPGGNGGIHSYFHKFHCVTSFEVFGSCYVHQKIITSIPFLQNYQHKYRLQTEKKRCRGRGRTRVRKGEREGRREGGRKSGREGGRERVNERWRWRGRGRGREGESGRGREREGEGE